MEEACEVELISVTKRYGKTVAADAVSLSIRRGEFLTLLGPSGCGKTTLLRMIAGFETPDEGRVILSREDVTRVPPYRRNVTTVFQHYALFPHLNVFANVAFGLERKGTTKDEIKKRVADALDLVRLTEMEDRRPTELSGGQQQRVALARALVLEPKVLLLDEPLAALDLKLRKQMQVELKSIQRRLGISFVFVTHDQEEALTMSDRIAVLNAGVIEQLGTAEEIYERPRTEFVARFIGDSNIITAVVERIEGEMTIVKTGSAQFKVYGSDVGLGEHVRVMVRPEKIALSETDGILSGRIESAVYQGESTIWKIATDDGQELIALEQNREPASFIEGRIGKMVSISWPAESAVMLKH
ncbi:MAG: ABC transporter ATP-binding protein [Acidobacteriota bacterium]